MNTLIVNDDAVPVDLLDTPKKHTRKFKGRVDMPDAAPGVVETTIDGKAAVMVDLFGSAANRLSTEPPCMVLDAEDWPRISAISEWWGLMSDGDGWLYVARGTVSLARLARQSPDSNPNVSLARLIMGASKTQRVVCGNPLDLRKASLALVESSAEVAAFYRSVRGFVAHLNQE